MEPLTGAAANGVNSLWQQGALVTVLVLAVMLLCYLVRALLLDAKSEREKYCKTLMANTEALNGLKEIISVAIAKG
jgi:hypothetical protein